MRFKNLNKNKSSVIYRFILYININIFIIKNEYKLLYKLYLQSLYLI